jgi:heme exporter protein D
MDLLHAGKYAVYVYPAYGLTALVLIGMTVQTLWAARAARREAEAGKTGGKEAGARESDQWSAGQ